MNLLKKHWEKLLLAAALLGVIVISLLLMNRIDQLQEDIDRGPLHRRPQNNEIETVDQAPYTNALHRLNNPFIWENLPYDPFRRSLPEQGLAMVETNVFEIGPDLGEGLSLVNVEWKPFKLLLKAYTYDEANQLGRNFQINFQSRSRTFVVGDLGDFIGDRYEQTGYKLVKFERKIVELFNPRLGAKVQRDASELTIQHEGEEPIVLIHGRVVREREPVATLYCDPGYPAQPISQQVRRGQRFECAGLEYIVVDIKPGQMIIKDGTTEEMRTLRLGVPSPNTVP